MPNDEFKVAPEELEQHAKSLDDAVLSKINRANDAAQMMGMGGPQPYGVLGIPVWLTVKICNQDSTEVTKAAAELGRSLSEKLRQTARTYEEVDQGIGRIMREI